MNTLVVLSQNGGKLLGPLAKLLGLLMNAIYIFLDSVCNIQNVALTIILFTIVIYLCLLPVTYQQQKFSKMSQIMNPEIQAIQKKYKGRRDQASTQAMQEETQAVYKKYGVSPSGSCIYLVIQLPILFALYRVIYNVPGYITRVKDTFTGVVDGIIATPGYQDTMQKFLETVSNKNSVFKGINLDFATDETTVNTIIDVLYKCTSKNWDLLKESFSPLADTITATQGNVEHFNSFLGASIVYSPKSLISTSFQEGQYLFILLGILIPVLAAATQFLNIRLMPQPQQAADSPMGGNMKMMNYMMPIYSVFIVFFLPIGVGIYWIAGSVIRCVQQFIINKQLDKVDMKALIDKNVAKAKEKEKKRIEKKGVKGEVISQAASVSTRNIPRTMAEKANVNTKVDVNNAPKKKYKEGSLAAKANLVNEYNNDTKK